MGRLSILVMSSSRSANTLSALNSCPAPSGTENTTLVLKSEPPDRAAQRQEHHSSHCLTLLTAIICCCHVLLVSVLCSGMCPALTR